MQLSSLANTAHHPLVWQRQPAPDAPPPPLSNSAFPQGGRGAMFSLDYVPSILASFGATEITTVGLLDAALWVDIDPMLPSITSQQCQTASLAVMANATGRMGEACLAAYPGDESWKCLYGEKRSE